VFNGCYHGAVDETYVKLERRQDRAEAGSGRPGRGPDAEFRRRANSTMRQGLKSCWPRCDIACVITEPVLTNSCMVLAQPGFHDAVRKLTRDTGTLLLIDETHTISTGLGGYTRTHGLDPDIFVLGKPVAGGVPASVWGLSQDLADRFAVYNSTREPVIRVSARRCRPIRCSLPPCVPAFRGDDRKNYAHMEKLAARLEKPALPK
jgi:glutamate-1-semialdehyde 2,1-aminomutase